MRAQPFLLAALACVTLAPGTAAQQQPPTFQSQIDVIPVDVTVVDDRGRPVEGLTPRDFTVRIDYLERER